MLTKSNDFDGLCKNKNQWFKENFRNESCETIYNQLIEARKLDFKDFAASSYKFSQFKMFENNLIAKLNDKNDKIFTTNEKYYALIIGNNNYEHLEKLDAAENDAKVLANVLQDKYGFEVDLLLNADYDTTVNSLFKITNKLKSNDNLLIY